MHHQLGLPEDSTREILMELPMATGKIAQSHEKRLHRRLAKTHPQLILSREALKGWIRVSEAEQQASDDADYPAISEDHPTSRGRG